MELSEAVEIAARAHRRQVYRGYGGRPNEPYILHPLRVMMAVSKPARVVAVLHDVLEDSDVHVDALDLLPEEREALLLLTRDKTQVPYARYIATLVDAEGPAGALARVVKIADLQDNMKHAPPGRLRDRYETALEALGVGGY